MAVAAPFNILGNRLYKQEVCLQRMVGATREREGGRRAPAGRTLALWHLHNACKWTFQLPLEPSARCVNWPPAVVWLLQDGSPEPGQPFLYCPRQRYVPSALWAFIHFAKARGRSLQAA